MTDTTGIEPESAPTTDLLWGATAIAEVINLSPRAVFHLLEGGRLPAKKVGKRWVASRQALIRALTGEAAA